jgi:hypothetical protein
MKVKIKTALKTDLCQTPLQVIDFKGVKQGVQSEGCPD